MTPLNNLISTHKSIERMVHLMPSVIDDFTILGWSHIYGLPYPSTESLDPIYLYYEPLGYIEEEELKRKETIVHCCLSFLILESASLCPFGALCVLPKLSFFVSFLSRDGGLRWWRTWFLRFVDMPTEVVTIVMFDFININIFSCPIMCIWIWILYPWMYLISYTLLNIYARVGLTNYYIYFLSCLLLLRETLEEISTQNGPPKMN